MAKPIPLLLASVTIADVLLRRESPEAESRDRSCPCLRGHAANRQLSHPPTIHSFPSRGNPQDLNVRTIRLQQFQD